MYLSDFALFIQQEIYHFLFKVSLAFTLRQKNGERVQLEQERVCKMKQPYPTKLYFAPSCCCLLHPILPPGCGCFIQFACLLNTKSVQVKLLYYLHPFYDQLVTHKQFTTLFNLDQALPWELYWLGQIILILVSPVKI